MYGRKSLSRKAVTRILLAGIAIGGLVAFVLLGNAKANADPDASDWHNAPLVCETLAIVPTIHGVDLVVGKLMAVGYTQYTELSVAGELQFALSNFCPQYIPLVNHWSHTPTGPNGSYEPNETPSAPAPAQTGTMA